MSSIHNKENRQKFAAMLKVYRKKHNLTQESLGRMLEVSVFTINRWEVAKHYPSASTIKLMKILKIFS